MINYLCRRFLQIVPVLFLITLIVFCLVYVAGDPVSLMLPLDAPPEQFEALRSSLGLDRPLPVQYLSSVSYTHLDVYKRQLLVKPVIRFY